MNKSEYEKNKITLQELASLQHDKLASSFSSREAISLEMTRMLTNAPVIINEDLIKKAKSLFSEMEYVIICTTISQVNYWSRMIKGFGVTEACPVKR